MNEDFIPQKKEGDQTEFNSAFAFLERINRIEYLIEDALMVWSHRLAFTNLESYENELAFCFKKEDKEAVEKLKQVIIIMFNNNPYLGQGKPTKGEGELRIKVVELNQMLRLIKHKNGMTMPKRGEGKLF